MTANPQRRHWCYTLWLPDDATVEVAEGTAKRVHENPIIRYAVCQAERNEDLTRIHLQGYVEFKRSLRRSEAKKALGGFTSMHLEVREGSRADARNYCISKKWKGKDKRRCAGPFETGVWTTDVVGSVPARKSQSETLVKCLLYGMTPSEIAAAHPSAFFSHSRKVMDTHEALRGAVQAGIFEYEIRPTQD